MQDELNGHMMRTYYFAFVFLLSSTIWGEVSCQFSGRLGNQLFQIAATMSLAEELNTAPLFFLKSEFPEEQKDLEENFRLVFPRIPLSDAPLPTGKVFKQQYYLFEKIPLEDGLTLHGLFHSEEYFKKHKETILPYFQPSQEILDQLWGKFPDILSAPNTVGVHVRCYFNEGPFWTNILGILSKDYFLQAMSLFPEDTLFVFFSDDMATCKKLFENETQTIRFIEGQTGIQDFYLMSLCRHNIISNSTYSWWSAYLNSNPDKVVIAPMRWNSLHFGKEKAQVIFPREWLLLDFDTNNPIRANGR